jgi:hypothetical protein
MQVLGILNLTLGAETEKGVLAEKINHADILHAAHSQMKRGL